MLTKLTYEIKKNETQCMCKVQNQVGWVKIGHFRQITLYNSKTVQDRRRVSIKVE